MTRVVSEFFVSAPFSQNNLSLVPKLFSLTMLQILLAMAISELATP